MRVYSPLCILLVIAAAFAAVPKAAAEDPDLTGSYKCVGDAGGGKQYEGTVKITREGDAYLLKWEIVKQRYTGVGILESGVLSVAIHDDNDDKYTGVVAYRVDKSGKMAGRWSAFGFKGMVLTETLTPQK